MGSSNYKEVIDNRVREIIEKAFDSKAEAYSYSELARYFKRRELLPTLIHQREHHVLKGRKGTGKTAILLYLSLPVQVHCAAKYKADFAGFYLTFSANIPPQVSFDLDTEKEIAILFGHWFNLYTCKIITDSIATAKGEGLQGISAEEEKSYLTTLWTSFFQSSDSIPNSLKDASSALDSYQSEIRAFLSEPSLSRIKGLEEYLSKRIKYRGGVTDVANFKEIIETVQKTMQIFKNKVIFILIDEYDNLSAAQQVVINTAIIGSTGQYYTKVGVLSEQGIKDRNTLTGLTLRDDQLKSIDLERFTSYKEYEDFAKAAIEARLLEIHKQVTEIPKLKYLFSDLDRLLPAKSPSDQAKEQNLSILQRRQLGQLSLLDMEGQYAKYSSLITDDISEIDIDGWFTLLKCGSLPTYCGIGIICLLSSGLIRSAIEIVYTILREALITHWDLVQKAQCIPYDIQDSAIRHEASYWMRTKLMANIKGRTWDGKETTAEVASRLISNLLKQFSNLFMSSMKEPALNCFSLRELRDPDADGIKALREGEIAGIFTQLDEGFISHEDAAVYALHRIYSVRNNLPPARAGCLRLSWDKFEEYCRPPRGPIGKQQEIEVPYFVGIGFREPWEYRVREELPSRSPARYIYSDGAGAHEGSILVVKTVENRIEGAQLCVFDITTNNENVYFEYGLALAKRKPVRHLLNQMKSYIKDFKKLPPFLQGIVIESYLFSDEPSEKELESLKKAIENIADWYGRYRKRKGHPCSLYDKCSFISVTPLNNQVFIVAPEGSLANRCLSDLHKLIFEDLRLQVYPLTQNVGPHYVCDFCQAAGRSKYCIVDTTNCDPTYCGILGLCFGYKRKVLNIYEKDRPGLITNYVGQCPKEYADKVQLIHNIRSFLQSY